MNPRTDRRSFLRRAAALIPALHAAHLLAMTKDDPPQPSVSGARFARLGLRSAVDLETMAAFYREVLRLAVDVKGQALIVTAGETIIEFAKNEPREGATNPYYHFAFNIPHNQLDSARAWLEPRCSLLKLGNGEFIANFQNWNAHAFYFLDPAGNILEFIARHTLKNEREGDFSEKNILCASEIGVVAPDVVKAADTVCESAKLERYRGGSDQFTAVGDENGLFIVVKTGRAWFSSTRKAEVFEAHAEVRGAIEPLRLDDCAFVASRAAHQRSP